MRVLSTYEAYVERSGFNQHKENEPFKLWESWIEKDVLDGNPEVLFEGDAVCGLTNKQFAQGAKGERDGRESSF